MIKAYDIDLSLPGSTRWAEVIEKEKGAALLLLEEFSKNLRIPGFLLSLFRAGCTLAGGWYRDEVDAWADGTGAPRGLLAAAQYAYELSQFGGYTGEIFGCTAAIVDHPSLGPTHLRYLDWDITGISRSTRLFRFHQGKRTFSVVGVPGFVGALSGVVPQGFSIAINQAPVGTRPHLGTSAAFLVRETLTRCDSYNDAVEMLTKTPISSPVFFSVCGTEKGEGGVIERGPSDYKARSLRGGRPLVLTNHHEHKALTQRNIMEQEMMDDSCERYHQVAAALQKPKATLVGMLKQMETYPTYSNITVQRMAFNPRNGGLLVLPD